MAASTQRQEQESNSDILSNNNKENNDDDSDETTHEDSEPPVTDSSIVEPFTEDATAATEATITTSTTPRCIQGIAPRTGPLNEAVASIANISYEQANELIDIGAVWAKLETLTEEDLLELYDEYNDENDANTQKMKKANARAMYADLDNYNDVGGENEDLDDYIERMEQIRFKRILTPTLITQGTDLRIYPNPRRFTKPAQEMYKDSIITQEKKLLLYEDTTFLVVDKPPMLPTQPDTSNYYECCPGLTQKYYGPFRNILGNEIKRPLLCHRVDACVGGCVVLSKDKNGQKVFQQYQRNRELKKLYLAVTSRKVPLGMHIHWMWAPQNIRGKAGGPPCQLLSHVPPETRRKSKQFWIRCVLQVTKCEPISINDGDDGKYYQNTIRLVTGRKHQVRAQLASLGCPIYKDTLYEPMSGITLDKLDTGGVEYEEEMDLAVSKCRIPTEPIGLQAHAILFGAGSSINVRANPPWWATTTTK